MHKNLEEKHLWLKATQKTNIPNLKEHKKNTSNKAQYSALLIEPKPKKKKEKKNPLITQETFSLHISISNP